ncbi:ABC transporter substrate-binding protein [Brevibacillus ginsengisoli]|uniref:ABC transporter substrate-binding protein n=1 Tax=Brevibacillus ginsengisoli TaxID=363854 RepID=UPI003CEF58F2
MKRQLHLLGFIGICLGMVSVIFAFIVMNNQKQPEPYRIGIVIANKDRNEKIVGLKEGIQKLGLQEKKGLEYFTVDLEGSRNETYIEKRLLELKNRKPDVIVTTGAWETISTKKVIKNIPIVFIGIASPNEWGLIQPQDLITGIDNGQMKLIGKRMELLQHICPSTKRILVVADKNAPMTELAIKEAQRVASELHLQIDVQPIASPEELSDLIRKTKPTQYQALFPLPSLLLEDAIVASLPLFIEQKLFVIGAYPEQVKRGLFAAYGLSFYEQGKQSATLVAKILNGSPVKDLPVELPDNVNLSVNEQTLEKLGIRLSQQQAVIVHQQYGVAVR